MHDVERCLRGESKFQGMGKCHLARLRKIRGVYDNAKIEGRVIR